nr:DUF4235 domain-containing protein [Streptomyces sp. TP-A0874]
MSMLFGVVGGMLAGKVFSMLWRRVAGEEEAPSATDQDHTWREVLLATAVQGAIASGVRAAVRRSGAAGVRKVTGHWPGD